MLPMLSERLSSFFVRSQIIQKEDKEVYSYSVEVLLATVLNFAVLYLIAFFTSRVWETTMFIAGFIPLRSLAGGYHAKTHLRCLAVLLLAYGGFLGLSYLASPEQYIFFNLSCTAGSMICVWLLSPVEDKNKPLNQHEKKFFKRRSRVAILVYAGVIFVGTLLFSDKIEFSCIAFGILAVSLSLAAAYFKNKRYSTPNGEAVNHTEGRDFQ